MKDAVTSPIDWSDKEPIGSKWSKFKVNLEPSQPDGEAIEPLVSSVEQVEVRRSLRKVPGKENASNAPSESYPEVQEVAETVAGLSDCPKCKKSKKELKSTCTICNRTFVRKFNYLRHMWTHSGSLKERKIHKCGTCQKRFVSVRSLWTHQNSQH